MIYYFHTQAVQVNSKVTALITVLSLCEFPLEHVHAIYIQKYCGIFLAMQKGNFHCRLIALELQAE